MAFWAFTMIKLSFLNLFRRKARTFLSVSGIAIGVAAIIVLVSLVDGFTGQFDEVVSQFKGVVVSEKDSIDQTVSRVDLSFAGKLASLPGVKVVVPEIWALPQSIDGKGLGISSFSAVYIYGLDVDKYYSSGGKGWLSDAEKGSLLRSSDFGQVMIGKKLAADRRKFVGSAIKVDGKTFKVKGILKGESDMVSSIIVMNLQDAREVTSFSEGKVSSYTVLLSDISADKAVAELIKLKYGDDLQAQTQADISEQLTGIVGNLRLLAIVIALVSSIVAGIGIANTILMSVLERFREIGALKAVGWTNGNVMKMIVYESLFMGVIGGLLGIAIGFGIDILLNAVGGVRYSISPMLLVSTLSFAIGLGIVAGLYPAYHASTLDPIEALRA